MILVFTSFFVVFSKGLQQLNVVHGHYYWAIITSWALALTEVVTLLYVVEMGWTSVPYMGVGASIGIVCAMWFHKHYIRKESKQ